LVGGRYPALYWAHLMAGGGMLLTTGTFFYDSFNEAVLANSAN